MSRINYPVTFAEQQTLLDNIKKKDTADPTVLKAFLTAQNIDLNSDVAAAAEARSHNEAQKAVSGQAENYRQVRDLRFAQPLAQIKDFAQFLKSVVKPNYKVLTEWGIPITDSGKINYPAAFVELADIYMAIVDKHSSYPPGESPLDVYLAKHGIVLADGKALVKEAIVSNISFAKAAREAENETELRNNVWDPVDAHIHLIGNFLKNLYTNNTRALGLWGFVIDDSTAKPKERTTKLLIGEKITINGVVLGSTVVNLGSEEIHLNSGKTANGDPIIIKPGGTHGITKGQGTITIVNPSKTAGAQFKAVVTR